MEKRKNPDAFLLKPKTKSTSSLPLDYTKMVADVFAKHFQRNIDLLEKESGSKPMFTVSGNIFSDEIILSVSLGFKNSIAPTTLHISADFDPAARFPTAQDLLDVFVDAAGSWLEGYLGEGSSTPEKREALLSPSMNAFEPFADVPYSWTEVEVEKRKVFIKADKSNPSLEEATNQWLTKHDPEFKEIEQVEEDEVKTKFVTGKINSSKIKH